MQTTDSAIARLRHRKANLPELADLSRLNGERAGLSSQLVAADTQVSDLEKETRKAERDLEPVRERKRRNETRIADGSVSDPKALNGLVEEVAHLARRIAELEDAELELMEQLEQAAGARDDLSAQTIEIESQVAKVQATCDQKSGVLDEEARGLITRRGQLAPDVPTDLMTLYTKLQASHGGVGAAELKARRCTGCQLEINAADLREMAAAPEDEVLRCEECGRILIRTENSGL